MRRNGHLVLLLLGLVLRPSLAPASDSTDAEPSPTDVLTRAFARPYACDFGMRLSLTMIDRWGDRAHRRLLVASKRINGRQHVIARITHPPPLRRTTLLTIENPTRGPDVFVFLPSLGRARRVAPSRSTDSLLGTDLTYGDIERRRPRDYAIVGHKREVVSGKRVHVLETRPVGRSEYGLVTLYVSPSSYQLREMRYFSRVRDELSRIVEFSSYREWPERDCVVPTEVSVRNLPRGTRTELSVEALHMDSVFDDSLFSTRFLESGNRIAVQ